MKKVFFKTATMLAFSGLVALSFVSTSCGDDDDDDVEVPVVSDTTSKDTTSSDTTSSDTTVTSLAPAATGFEFADDGSIVVNGTNLSQITKVELGGITLEGDALKVEGETLTISLGESIDNLEPGKQPLIVTYKDADGTEKQIEFDVTVPEKEVVDEPVDEPVDENDPVLFSGSEDLGAWANAVVIPAAKLTGITSQTLISVKGDLKSEATTEYQQIQLKSGAEGWPALEATMNTVAGQLYPIFDGQFNFTLSEKDIDDVKENGLIVAGQGITITDVVVIGTQVTETLATDVASYNKFATRDTLNLLTADAIAGYSKVVFHCALAIEEDNRWDYVGQLAGWDASWTNSTDSFDDFTFKLNGKVPTGAKGETFDIEFNLDDILEKLPGTEIFCVNVWDGKFEIKSAEVTYVTK